MSDSNFAFYLKHTHPNDAVIENAIASAEKLGTFEQHTVTGWLFRGTKTVGHILDVSHKGDPLFLVCFADKPYMAFHSLDDAQKRMLALDLFA